MSKNDARSKILRALAKTENYLKNVSSKKIADEERDKYLREIQNIEENLMKNNKEFLKNKKNDISKEENQKNDKNLTEKNDNLENQKTNTEVSSENNSKESSKNSNKETGSNVDTLELLKQQIEKLSQAAQNLEKKSEAEIKPKGSKEESLSKEESKNANSESEDSKSTNNNSNEKNISKENEEHKEKYLEQENSKKSDVDIKEINVSLLTHEQFVLLVKGIAPLEDKIRLMGKRIHFLSQKVKVLEEEKLKLKQGSISLLSNYEEDKKRIEDEISEHKKFALKDFIFDMIGTIDIFEMAINAKTDNKDIQNWLVGFKMIFKKLFDVLESNGVKKMEINTGDNPDYNFHNIIEIVDTKEVEDGKIVDVRQSGYLLNGKLLRVASVSVAKNPLKDKNSSSSTNKDEKK